MICVLILLQQYYSTIPNWIKVSFLGEDDVATSFSRKIGDVIKSLLFHHVHQKQIKFINAFFSQMVEKLNAFINV